MKIVAFLQNQWFKHPERHVAFVQRYPKLREQMIYRFLFAGCKTGQMLGLVFQERCKEIVWEETSRQIGGHAASLFPPDFTHIVNVCRKHNPDIILAFGKQATDALQKRNGLEYLICGPHPANRRNSTLEKLKDMRLRLEALEKAYVNGDRDLNRFCNLLWTPTN